MFIHQTILKLRPRSRGFHLITSELLSALPEVAKIKTGFLHLFLQHTSASILIGENADPDVRADMERWANQAVPDGAPYFEHTLEGVDDMPAHVKSGLFGGQHSIPIRNGSLLLGTWQGIYLGEHRDGGGSRNVVATIWGQD